MAIEAIKVAQALTPRTAVAGAGQGAAASGFGDKLAALVEQVEQTNTEANDAVTGMINKTGDVHDAMIALQRAEMTLQMTMQIRNKLVQAYQEIMRMPV